MTSKQKVLRIALIAFIVLLLTAILNLSTDSLGVSLLIGGGWLVFGYLLYKFYEKR